MKEQAAIEKHSSLKRRESSRSLEVDASSSSSTSCPSSSSSISSSSSSFFTYPSIPRRASTQSLKTVRSLDQSPIKEEEEGEKSLSLKRSLTRKLSFFFEAEQSSSPSSSGWNHGLSSLSYLKTLGALGLSPGKKQTENNEATTEEEESDTLKKRLSRRLSSLFDGGSTGGNSDAVSSSPASSPIPDSSNISELRGVKRGDLPICWIESLNASSPSATSSGQSLDLLTRLASRVYTRHLAREILQHLSKQVTHWKYGNLTQTNHIIDWLICRTWQRWQPSVTPGESCVSERWWQQGWWEFIQSFLENCKGWGRFKSWSWLLQNCDLEERPLWLASQSFCCHSDNCTKEILAICEFAEKMHATPYRNQFRKQRAFAQSWSCQSFHDLFIYCHNFFSIIYCHLFFVVPYTI